MKQILEILDKYYDGDYNVDCAKEIHEHYMKFVEWKDKSVVDLHHIKIQGKSIIKPNYVLEDLYQHYCDNVLNKDAK